MALYNGFFDAEYSDGEYDRTYNAAQHVEYYSYFIGSGVCISEDEDSFLVTCSGTTVTIAPGFLFINGYWLKNDANYTLTLPSTGTYAILAKLDTTSRAITLTYQAVASSYSNALCLASINVDAGTCVDTRDDDTICGLIDSIGNVSDKAAYAQNYADTTVADTLSSLSDTVTEAVEEIEESASEIEAMAELLDPPAVGELRYACAAPSDKWLLCDGRTVSTSSYSDLAALLGKAELLSSTAVSTSGSGYYSDSKKHAFSNVVIGTTYAYYAEINTDADSMYGNVVYLYRITLSTLAVSVIYVDIGESGGITDSYRGSGAGVDTLFNGKHPLCLSVCTYSGTTYFFVTQQTIASERGESTSYNYVTGVSFTLSGTTAQNKFIQSSLHAYLTSTTGFAALPYVRVAAGRWYFVSSYSNSGTVATANVVYCSVLPVSGNTISSSSFSTTTYATTTLPQVNDPVVTEIGYNTKNSEDAMIVAGSTDSDYSGMIVNAYVKYVVYSSTSASYQGSYTNSGYTDGEDNYIYWPEDYSSSETSRAYNLPVYGNGYIIGPVQIGFDIDDDSDIGTFNNRILVATVLKVSGKGLYNVHIDDNPNPYARIFPESVCYASGYYFIFVGCGIYYSSTPSTEGSWTYVSTIAAAGRIVSEGGIAYDSTYSRLLVFGHRIEGKFSVVALPLTNFASVTESTISLPSTTKGTLNGYIKAVSG